MAGSVRVLFFATAREAVGRPSIDWALPTPTASVGAVVAELSARFPKLGPVLRSSRLVKNGEYVNDGARVVAGDELAVHPPYSGG